MNEDAVKNWLMKANNDLKTAKDEIVTDEPATDTVCFHAQQYVEKSLKAFLIYNGKEIKRILDIAVLIREWTEIDEDFNQLFKIEADKLTDYAIEIRYSEEFYIPSIDEAKDAIEIAERVKYFILGKLKNKGFENA